MDHLAALRAEVDALLDGQADAAERHAGFAHLNAVSQTSALLAAQPGKASEPPKAARIRSAMAELGLQGWVHNK